MNSFDECVVWQIVKDYNFLPVKGKKCVKLAGGTAFYSTQTYYKLVLKKAVPNRTWICLVAMKFLKGL